MGEEHARVALALGAYAVGALEPEEAAEVRAHLETCAACRAEAERLARAAAWLGTTQEAPPPERLRDAVLASAAARDDLDRLLDGLTAEQRRVPVIHGWDADELLRHLAAARPGLAAGPDGMLQRAFETWIHADDLRVALGRAAQPAGSRSPARRRRPGGAAAAAGHPRPRRGTHPAGPSPCASRGLEAGPGRCRPAGPVRWRPPSPLRRSSSST